MLFGLSRRGLASAAGDLRLDDDSITHAERDAAGNVLAAAERQRQDAKEDQSVPKANVETSPVAASEAVASAAPADAAATAVAAERTRMKAVFASEHFAGREQLACELLDSELSQDRIVAMLAKTPKAGADNAMLDRLASTPNPELGAGSEPRASTSTDADAIWDRARAANISTHPVR